MMPLISPIAIAHKIHSSPVAQVLSLDMMAPALKFLNHPTPITAHAYSIKQTNFTEPPAAGNGNIVSSPNIPYDDYLQAFVRRMIGTPRENNVDSKQAGKQMAGAGAIPEEATGETEDQAEIPQEGQAQYPIPAGMGGNSHLKAEVPEVSVLNLFAPHMKRCEDEVFEFEIEVRLPDVSGGDLGGPETEGNAGWKRIYRGEFWFF